MAEVQTRHFLIRGQSVMTHCLGLVVLIGVSYLLFQGDTPLDCLLKWHKRTDTRFGPVEQTLFEEIQMRLRMTLEKG